MCKGVVKEPFSWHPFSKRSSWKGREQSKGGEDNLQAESRDSQEDRAGRRIKQSLAKGGVTADLNNRDIRNLPK